MIRAIAAAALVSVASPVQGSVSGPVVAVKGTTFTITTPLSPNGRSVVSAAGAHITEQAPAPRSSLKVGACVMANGAQKSKGVIAADRISITAATKGSCAQPVVRQARPPGGGTPPASGGFRTGGSGRPGGFAFGQVTKIAGSTLTVKGPLGTTAVTISSKTALTHLVTIKASAITTKTCAFVRGTSTDKGKTVKAADVSITPERNGSCTAFRIVGR
jgi:uncharacterized protein DUF5666